MSAEALGGERLGRPGAEPWTDDGAAAASDRTGARTGAQPGGAQAKARLWPAGAAVGVLVGAVLLGAAAVLWVRRDRGRRGRWATVWALRRRR